MKKALGARYQCERSAPFVNIDDIGPYHLRSSGTQRRQPGVEDQKYFVGQDAAFHVDAGLSKAAASPWPREVASRAPITVRAIPISSSAW
ncbi:MAG: hypothetical protein ACRDTC_08935 [Pseudonocardiaceae bacterium]